MTWHGRRFAFLAYTSVFTPGMEASETRTGMAVIKIDATYRIPTRLHEVPGSPLACDTQARPEHVARMIDDIVKTRLLADEVIVSMHWGVSMSHQHLIAYQIAVGHAAIDAGADLVIGHHPHTIQPIEIYKGKTIAYSLAQCGFDMKSHHHSNESIALEIELTKKGFGKTRVRPLTDSEHHPRIVSLREGASTIEWLRRMSRPHGTIFTDDGEAVVAHHEPSVIPREHHYSNG